MNNDIRDTAVCYSNLAEACLYFDHILPLGVFFDDVITALPHVKAPEDLQSAPRVPREFLPELLPPSLRRRDHFRELERLHTEGMEAFLQWMEDIVKGKSSTHELAIFDSWLRNTRTLTERMGLLDCTVVTEPNLLPHTLEASVTSTDFAATMTSLHLVKASRLSWDQIREFRRDPLSRMKLRRLRLFFAENYVGKDRRYVEDDLHRVLDDYAATVKSWGFETRAQVTTMLLSSKWVAGALSGSALSAILGAPIAAVVTGSTGLVLELGNIVIEITKRRHALRRLSEASPISYVADLQMASQSDSASKVGPR